MVTPDRALLRSSWIGSRISGAEYLFGSSGDFFHLRKPTARNRVLAPPS